jgi:hypothetical protein
VAVAVAVLAFTPTSSVPAAGDVLLPECSNVSYGGRAAPLEWSSGCLGGSVNLGSLLWRDWGRPSASANGVVHYNTCEPSCAAGSIYDYPVELSVGKIRRCASSLGPRRYYTQFTVVFDFPPENAAGRPPGRSEPFTFSASCPTPGYLVKLGGSAAAFGAFVESGEYDGDRLETYFGRPTKRKRGRYLSCEKHWRKLGLTVRLGAIDPEVNPCYSGRFIGAILKGRRWHTSSGVRVGVRARKAAEAAARGCTIRLCRTRGYVLSQHYSVCGAGRYPSVVAETRRGRVRRLLVLSHFCE